MGIIERRNAEKAEMRRKIMTAAVEIIEEEGYEQLSIRKIAAKIEYSPTTIYLYYKDKAEIITDMSEVLYGKVMEHAEAVLMKGKSLPVDEQVAHMLHSVIQALCSEPEMAKAIMYSGADVIFSNSGTEGTPTNPGIELLDRLLADGIAQKVFRPGIENTSWMIVSALLGFVMSAIGNQLYRLNDFDKLVNDYVELLMGGIKQ